MVKQTGDGYCTSQAKNSQSSPRGAEPSDGVQPRDKRATNSGQADGTGAATEAKARVAPNVTEWVVVLPRGTGPEGQVRPRDQTRAGRQNGPGPLEEEEQQVMPWVV